MEKKTDLRIERTYLFLHNAFTSLLEEKRFEDFTVNELCERAMIRRTTFYKHFADKYEYFTFYMKEICASFQDQLPPDFAANDTGAYFLHMSRELLRFVNKHEKFVGNIVGSSMLPVLLDLLSEQITNDSLCFLQRINRNRELSSQQLEGYAAFYAGGLLNTLRGWLKQGLPISEEQFIPVITAYFGRDPLLPA